MERLVDSYQWDEAPVLVPLHPNEYAYQSGKSVETAFHRLVVRVEKVLDRQETTLTVLLGIEGHSTISAMITCVMVLSDMGVIKTLFAGIRPRCRVQM